MQRRCVAIGPAAVKLGQALSTRPDLVGEKAAANLSQLQDDLPPAPFAKIKQTIETSFSAPLDSLYSEFEEVPVGAASIAQVHRAVTTEGREVAVKVLRPGIEEEFAKALETYEWAAAHVERYGGEAAAAAPAPGRRPFPAMDRARARSAARSSVGVGTAGEHGRRARLSYSRRSTGAAPRGASSRSNGSTGSSSTTATR